MQKNGKKPSKIKENRRFVRSSRTQPIKAVQSFSKEKNVRFSTYASKCIDNEVLMVIRKIKQTENTLYLDDSIDSNDKTAGKLTIKDSLPDNFQVGEYCEDQELKSEMMHTVLEKLDSRQRQIIILRYGLFGNQPQTQQQVCEMLGISRSYISRLEKRAIEILREYMLDEL